MMIHPTNGAIFSRYALKSSSESTVSNVSFAFLVVSECSCIRGQT